MESIWNETKNAIKEKIPSNIFNMWIEPLEFSTIQDESFIISCPNPIFKKRVVSSYIDLISSEIIRLSGKPYKLLFVISNDKNAEKPQEVQQMPLPNLNMRQTSGRLLRKDFTFDQFVVSSNNKFAYSAALSLASKKNNVQNSLYLLAKTGMGKSHLSQAIGHHILSSNLSECVYYITAEDFTNEMVSSFRNNSIDIFKDKYRKKCDVLMIEDVHFLSGKERTQTELALTLDSLFDSDKKIIFTSCYLPGDIPKVNDSLRSRLSYGIISNIEPPDYRTRVRILEKKAKINGFVISDEVIQYLASELNENVRQLESGLIGIATKASLLGVPITLELAESVVKNISHKQSNITIDTIKEVICKHYKIPISELISSKRKETIVRPRQIAMYLSRKFTDQPLQVIGRSFNRYHATALHAINTIEKEIKGNGPIQKQVEYLCEKLESGKY